MAATWVEEAFSSLLECFAGRTPVAYFANAERGLWVLQKAAVSAATWGIGSSGFVAKVLSGDYG